VELRGADTESKAKTEQPGIAVDPSLQTAESSHGRGTVAAVSRTVKAKKHARAVFGTAQVTTLDARNGKSSPGSGPAVSLTGKMSLLMATLETACGAAAIRHSSGRRPATTTTRVTVHGSAEMADGLAAMTMKNEKPRRGLIEW